MFWNELGHLLKPIINVFILIIATNKTHSCLKSIKTKHRVKKIKQKQETVRVVRIATICSTLVSL